LWPPAIEGGYGQVAKSFSCLETEDDLLVELTASIRNTRKDFESQMILIEHLRES
jgi:hypothetical protein